MSKRDTPTIRRRTVLRGTAAGTAAALGVTVAAADEHEDDENAGAEANGAILEEGPTIGLETVAEGLTAPVALVTAEEETDRRFIVDQAGQVYIHDDDGLHEDPFLDVTDEMVDINEDFDERGLLGLAFHPDFEENGQFFAHYSAEGEEPEYGAPGAEVPDEVDHLTRISRFETADDDNEEADIDSEEILLEVPQPQFNHNGGPIAFGPDDYLYIALGDGGGAGDVDEGHVEDWYDENEGGNGQDTQQNLLGGILRIDVDDNGDVDVENDDADNGDENGDADNGDENGDAENGDENGDADNGDAENGDQERAYGIPDDNPLVDYEDEGHLPEYWAWGIRNPWGMSFENDELLAADVGQALFEIVNHVQAGGNYAWNVWEGTHCFDPDSPEEPPEDCPDTVEDDGPRDGEPLLGPVIEYPQVADAGRYAEEYDEAGGMVENDRIGVSMIGGRMYEGDEVDDLDGAYIFGDWSRDSDSGGRLMLARPPEDWAGDAEETDVDEDDENDTDDENGVNDENDTDDENGVNDENDTDDENDIDDEGAADLEQHHPPDEVDLWPLEELSVEIVDGNDVDDDENGVDDDENDTDDENGADDENGEDDAIDEDVDVDEEEVDKETDDDGDEDDDEPIAEDGQLNHYIYGFGRDNNGDVYVLTTNTSTVEGEGFVSRIVAPDGGEIDDEDEMDDEDENDTDSDEVDDENGADSE